MEEVEQPEEPSRRVGGHALSGLETGLRTPLRRGLASNCEWESRDTGDNIETSHAFSPDAVITVGPPRHPCKSHPRRAEPVTSILNKPCGAGFGDPQRAVTHCRRLVATPPLGLVRWWITRDIGRRFGCPSVVASLQSKWNEGRQS